MIFSFLNKIVYLWASNRKIFISEKVHALAMKDNDVLILDVNINAKNIFVFSKVNFCANAINIKKTKHGFLYYLSFQCLLEKPNITKGINLKILNNFMLLSKANGKSILEIFDVIYPKRKINNLFVFSDRDDYADDNSEYLLRHLIKNRRDILEDGFFYFLNNNEHVDSEIENIRVPVSNDMYVFLIKHCAMFISSQIDFTKLRYLNYLSKFIFLQHGVILNNVSSWLNYKKIDLIVTSTMLEHESIVSEVSPYRITPNDAILCGMPRFDFLYEQKDKINADAVIIAPTWRQYAPGSKEMRFYIDSWCEFLLSEMVKELSLHSEIVFIAHPKIITVLNSEIRLPSYISFKKPTDSYCSLFLRGRLLITDFSSISFDMAYLMKNTIYYQFDRESFYSSGVIRNNNETGFDYYQQGFGPVCHTLNEMELAITNFNNGALKNKYQERFLLNFKNIDGNNSNRLIHKIFDSGWYL